MKKLLTVVLALIMGIACLSGCAPGEVEQTNKSLTVAYYGTDFGAASDVLNKASALFRINYPDVELIIEREPRSSTDGGKEYFTKLAAEIMAGKGPDLFWINTSFMDVYKMMDAGAFADLAPFVDADPDFSGDAYNTAVLNGCRYKEHLYIMPLNYFISGMLGRKELLEEVGFDYQNCTDCVSQWEELARYTEQYNADPSLPKTVRAPRLINWFPNCTGLPWLDMENKQADLSDSRWETVFKGYSLVYNTMTQEEKTAPLIPLVTTAELTGRDFLFDGYQDDLSYEDFVVNARLMAKSGTPLFYPFYDINGGVQAQVTKSIGVRRTSPNRQNAYNFIKILLDPEVQYLSGSFAPESFPLSNEALERSLKKNQEEMSGLWMFDDKSLSVSDFYPLPDETVRSVLEATEKVNGVYFINRTRRKFLDSMFPYIDSEMTYEEAIQEAEATLKIYVSE